MALPLAQIPAENQPFYYRNLGEAYIRQTGYSTYQLFALSLEDIKAIRPINKDSAVHDNAAGAGVVATALINFDDDDLEAEVLVTDRDLELVKAAEACLFDWPNVRFMEADAHNLAMVAENSISHSILNFSVHTLDNPLQALKEMYRTLQPGGIAVITTWKRYGTADVIHAAQALIRPDLPAMKFPRPELMKEGALEQLVVEAGFRPSDMQSSQKSILTNGIDLERLKTHLLGEFTASARDGWTEEEKKRWPDALEQAARNELRSYHGVRHESWVVLALK